MMMRMQQRTGLASSLFLLLLLGCGSCFLETTEAWMTTTSTTLPQLHHAAAVVSTFSQRRSLALSAALTTTTSGTGPPPGCSVQVTDPQTGCQVLLVGCFHGSQSSARDVEQALLMSLDDNDDNATDDEGSSTTTTTTTTAADVVVLELCASRFADLRRDLQATYYEQQAALSVAAAQENNSNGDITAAAIQTNNNNKKTSHGRYRRPWLVRFTDMVRTTWNKKGVSTATAAAVLGSVSGLQTALSGLQPGLEFTTALNIVATTTTTTTTCRPNNNKRRRPDIILADQAVDETLTKLGKLPQTSWQMCRHVLQGGTMSHWQDTFGKEAAALRLALLGNGGGPYYYNNVDNNNNNNSVLVEQVTLPGFLTRSRAAVQDLFRLLVPPILLLQALNLAASQAEQLWQQQQSGLSPAADQSAAAAASAVAAAASSSSSSNMALVVMDNDSWSGVLFVIAANAVFLLLNYLVIALPACRVILSERDDQLTRGIQAACQMAAAEQQQQQEQNNNGATTTRRPGRVVAVLGFLHVNGVAQRLVASSSSSSSLSNGVSATTTVDTSAAIATADVANVGISSSQ